MLSRDCEDHMRTVIGEAAMDYRQDPLLTRACKKEVQPTVFLFSTEKKKKKERKRKQTETKMQTPFVCNLPNVQKMLSLKTQGHLRVSKFLVLFGGWLNSFTGCDTTPDYPEKQKQKLKQQKYKGVCFTCQMCSNCRSRSTVCLRPR